MASYETEQPNDAPLSPRVVQGFVNVCANLHIYGENIRAKRSVLTELNVINDRLVINEDADRIMVTHQASGWIQGSPYGLTIHEVEIWTPLESVMPKRVKILGREVTMKTVFQDSTTDHTLPFYNDTVRSLIVTAENRMYQISSNLRDPRDHIVSEFEMDRDVENETNTLIAFENELQEGYPDVAKKFPEK